MDQQIQDSSMSAGPEFRPYMRHERRYESVLVRGHGHGKRTYERFNRGLREAGKVYDLRHLCLGTKPAPAWVILPEKPSRAIRRQLGTLPFDTRVGYGRIFPDGRLQDVFRRLGIQMDRIADGHWSGTGSTSRSGTRYQFCVAIGNKPLTHRQVLRVVRRAAHSYDSGKLPLPVDVCFGSAQAARNVN
jgi:hypothetical protein